MKLAIGFFFLLQLCVMALTSLLFWSQPARGHPDPYAQIAATFVGIPALILSALAFGLIYKWRNALPEQYRERILLLSTAMAIVAALATASGFLGVGFG